MANYPQVKQDFGSVKESGYDTQPDVTVSGAIRLRSLYSQEWSVFNIQHTCTETQKDQILDHHTAHAAVSFSFLFVADGQTYTVRYAGRPQARLPDLSGDWEVKTVLVQV